MTPTLAGQLERDTLERWTDQASLLDVARLYDVLRESLTLAYQDYRDARRRGWRGDAGADKALAEVADLVAPPGVCADEFVWRKLQYWHANWHWPLVAPGW